MPSISLIGIAYLLGSIFVIGLNTIHNVARPRNRMPLQITWWMVNTITITLLTIPGGNQ